jgi:hypothetical protein
MLWGSLSTAESIIQMVILTKHVYHAFVTRLKQDEEILDKHSQCSDSEFVFQIIQIKLDVNVS